MSNVICFDFDGTINSFNYPELGPPTENTKEVLQELKDMGFEIHILSCRTNIEVSPHKIDRIEQVRLIENYMEKYDLPYDRVLNENKPIAFAYVDDRGINFNSNMRDVLQKIKEL